MSDPGRRIYIGLYIGIYILLFNSYPAIDLAYFLTKLQTLRNGPIAIFTKSAGGWQAGRLAAGGRRVGASHITEAGVNEGLGQATLPRYARVYACSMHFRVFFIYVCIISHIFICFHIFSHFIKGGDGSKLPNFI